MVTPIAQLRSILAPSSDIGAPLRVLGAPYESTDPAVLAFAQALQASDEFAEDWPSLLTALQGDLPDQRGPLADAKLLLLFSHYLVTVRATAASDELLPATMMTWLGKGESRIPAENTVWFLRETAQVGSEAARDAIQVIGGETTFLSYFLSEESDAIVLEQAGTYLAMLLDLRQKWPDHYAWLPMHGRMHNIRELLLLGSDELPVVKTRGKLTIVPKDIAEVYHALTQTMHKSSFFTLLASYVAELSAHKGELTATASKIRTAMLND